MGMVSRTVVAILMALPPVFKRFSGQPTIVRSVEHHILDDTGNAQSLNELRSMILQCVFTGVRANASCFDFEPIPPLHLPDGQQWIWDSSITALDHLLPLEH